jgi:hypothetical protein
MDVESIVNENDEVDSEINDSVANILKQLFQLKNIDS